MIEFPKERRMRQRVVTMRDNMPGFWLESGVQRWRVVDLSLDGCGLESIEPVAGGRPFPFVLLQDGSRMQVRGEAQSANFHPGGGNGLCGCRFVNIEQDGNEILWGWLTRYVMDVAAVPLHLREAEDIVSGPSRV